MKNVAFILMLVAGLSTTAHAAGSAEAGKVKSITCAACHGADGNSQLTTYPKLAGQSEGYLAKQLMEFRQAAQSGGSQGRNNAVMNGMAMTLTDQDIADLAAYYAGQQMTPGTTPESAVALGEDLYRGGDAERGVTACIGCHGPRGNGTALSGFPKVSFQHADYTAAQLKMFRSGERNNDMNGMMRAVAKNLTDEDIATLAAYLGGLH